MTGRSIRAKRMRRRFLTVFAVAGIISSLTFVGSTAVAITTSAPFELDGNPVVNGGSGHDWAQVKYDKLNGTSTSEMEAVAWQPDGSNTDGTDVTFGNSYSIFTGGGSKDPQPLAEWRWKNGGGLPDKDNLMHVFAARRTASEGTSGPEGTYLYFGSDRYDNSGDATQGFWFLQKRIYLDPEGDNLSGGAFFKATDGSAEPHSDGDILVISEFSNGGSKARMSVFLWWAGCGRAGDMTTYSGTQYPCADANLLSIGLADPTVQTGEFCGIAGSPDKYCGIVNLTQTTGDWAFNDKRKTGGYAPNEFFEGVINLSNLATELENECFGSLLAESRSSTSTSATLKDFVLTSFEECDSDFSTTPADGDGTAITDPVTTGISITTGGSVEVRDLAELTIGGASTWVGTLNFYLCGVADVAITSVGCDPDEGRFVSSQAITHETVMKVGGTYNFMSDSTSVTSAGYYCWYAEFVSGTPGLPDATDGSTGECFRVRPVQPTIETSAATDTLVGQPLVDVAKLTGTAQKPTGGDATGGIIFRVYGPQADDDETAGTCSVGNLRATITVAVTSGDGEYSSGTAFTPAQGGYYFWVAEYTGDAPNTDPTTGSCGDMHETSFVITTPGLATTQWFYPQDRATITVVGAPGDIEGTVTFKLFVGSEACAGDPNWQDDINVDAPGTVVQDTNNVTVAVSDGTTAFSWWVGFDSDNPAIADIPGQCREKTTLSISDGTSYGP